MLPEKLKNYRVTLASRSTRRKALLTELGIPFKVETTEVEESWPENLDRTEIATHLSKLKAHSYGKKLTENELLITADTMVWLNGQALGKPAARDDAIRMLQQLSGLCHTVVTGVCLKSKEKTVTFCVETGVQFKMLTKAEIDYYVDNYKPYDKAGAYGIQEWIGVVGIERIDGSYTNVVGLPVKELYEELMRF